MCVGQGAQSSAGRPGRRDIELGDDRDGEDELSVTGWRREGGREERRREQAALLLPGQGAQGRTLYLQLRNGGQHSRVMYAPSVSTLLTVR